VFIVPDLLKSGKSCISPITSGMTILKYTDLPTDFSFWDKLSYDLLEKCSEMDVLMVDGWYHSTGVLSEIEHAKKLNIKINYIKISLL
jgi:hypothetical protein